MAFIRCPKCHTIIDGERKECPFCGCIIHPEIEEDKSDFLCGYPDDISLNKEEPKTENEEVVENSSNEDIQVEESASEPIIAEPVNEEINFDKGIKEDNEPKEDKPYFKTYNNNKKVKPLKQKSWVSKWQNRPMIIRLIFLGLFVIFGVISMIYFAKYEASKEVIIHDNPYYYWEETNSDFELLNLGLIFMFLALAPLMLLIASITAFVHVKKVHGYDVVIYGFYTLKLIVEGNVVDSTLAYRGRYILHPDIKMSGRLPDGTIIIATVRYSYFSYETFIEAVGDK